MALMVRHQLTGAMPDVEEAISLADEGLRLQLPPHPLHLSSLRNLVLSLTARYEVTHELSHLQETITRCKELLASYFTVGHRDRAEWLLKLASLLQTRFDATGQDEDLAGSVKLREEANRLSASSPEFES